MAPLFAKNLIFVSISVDLLELLPNVFLNVVTPVLNLLLENPYLPSTALANVDFASFAKAVLLDKSLIVNVGALLDKKLVFRTAKVAVPFVVVVNLLVLLKEKLLLKIKV